MRKKENHSPKRARGDFQKYMRALSPRSVLDHPNVEAWEAAGRATLLVALGVLALQYYFLHVYVEILSLPAVTVFT
jgi:hypothetical protein